MDINQVQALIYGLEWLNNHSDNQGISQKNIVFKTEGLFLTANWINDTKRSNNFELNRQLDIIFNPTHNNQPLNYVFEHETSLLKDLMQFVKTVDFNDANDFPFEPNEVSDINFLGSDGIKLRTCIFNSPIELIGII